MHRHVLAGSFQVLSVRKKFSSMGDSGKFTHGHAHNFVIAGGKDVESVAQHITAHGHRTGKGVCVCVCAAFFRVRTPVLVGHRIRSF